MILQDRELGTVPDPRPGERPVKVADAAEATGYSEAVIRARIRRGILPSVVPLGYERGRRVYVSQLLYVMEGTNDS